MRSVWIDFVAGMFVIAALFVLFIVSLNMSTRDVYSARNTYALKADFTDVSGLRDRAPVRIAGVKIGDVSKIGLNKNTAMAQVTMRVSNQYRGTIPDDSVASILTEGILGAKYVSIEPGLSNVPLGHGGRLVKTNPAMVLEKLVNKIVSKVL